ncbi:MAG: hypothetical protein D6738_00775 [Acidobacteria bacterium]|nr:MAG: hypothetical protein D6738_00775 [Acidobacteriota bacterium]
MRLLSGFVLSCAAVIAAFAADPAPPRVVHAPRPERARVVVPRELPRAAGRAAPDSGGVIPNRLDGGGGAGAATVRPGGAPPLPTPVDPSRPAATDAVVPAIDVRFDAVTDGWTPPDPVMAVGRDHVVVLINTRIAFYDKAGTLVDGPYSLSTFFGIPSRFFEFDPLAIYDPHSDRFIVTVLADDSAARDSRIYVAFSQTGDATGAWNVYDIDADRDQADNWADYASIGLDRNAVYLTANMFSRTDSFRNVTLFIYDKQDGYAGTPLDNTHLIDVRTASNGSPFRLRPAFVEEVVPGDAYFLVQSGSSIGSEINVLRLTGPRFAGPTLDAFAVPLPLYFGAGSGRQPSGSGAASLGGSVWNGWYRGGRLWTAHAVGSSGDDVAWIHRIDVTATPTLEQTYELRDPGADVFFPYVVPDTEDDDFALLSAYSSPSVNVTGRYWNVAADGTVRGFENLRDAPLPNNSGRHGDYFAVGRDPRDPNRLWMIAQYMNRRSTSSGDQVVASARFEDVPAPGAPPPVPDGATVAGQPVQVTRAGGGDVTVTWDATTCPAPDNHLVWYDLAQMASYVVAAETCAVGSSGSWTGTPPGGSVGVIVVGHDPPSDTEGSHGTDSTGAERPSQATTCAAVKATAGTCVP